jgi:hypothetical protein
MGLDISTDILLKAIIRSINRGNLQIYSLQMSQNRYRYVGLPPLIERILIFNLTK